ncbi:arylsulfatase [Fusarium subglutinans]|uniref:Arylsulfatase n=1 Tax=Gibberella subglutinans TaxID=42677 RepID=A0A8H5V532_GIBSU|nr:arylsulfatase [Fusarium subglutinans]KAF5608554.1 arylsulfatase [Fusarium subglutinans]
MDKPDDHAIALSIAQAVEADAELIAALIREEEQARQDFELARQLAHNPNAMAEADGGADHGELDDETYRTLRAFNIAAQHEENTGVEAEPIHEETHEASSVAGGDETDDGNTTDDDPQADAEDQNNREASQDDVFHMDEAEIQAEDSQIDGIQHEDTQEERDADEHPGTAQAASPAHSDLRVGTKECLYCTEEFPEDEVFEAPCSHGMCQPCLIRGIQTAIKDESLFPPKCCGQAIPVNATNAFITEDLLTEYDNKHEEFETTDRKYCSDKACSAFIPLRAIEAGVARCTRCEKRTCLNCLSEAHEGTCIDDPESQRVVRLAEENGWRSCDRCKNMVELTHGCFHISCRCGHQFCYRCGRQWKTCNCPQWEERHLVARAVELAAAQAQARARARALAPVARPVQPPGCRHRNYRPFDRVEGEDECDDYQAVLSPNDDAAQSEPKTRLGGKKNIVFILTDDQDAVLDSVSYMPKLKEHIIDKGTSFVNHFTTTAICCPSRVALWTGKQPHNTNVTDVNPPYGGFPKFVSQGLNENYLPVWLKEAGYKTYYTGKLFNAHTIHNYNSPYPAGWTGTNFLLDPGTYDYLNPIYQHNQEPPVQHKGVHTSDLISKYAHELLKEATDSKNPFFIAIAPVAPHSNVNLRRQPGTPRAPLMTTPIPLERHTHLFEGVKVPRTENFNPDSPSGVSWIHKLAQLNDSSVSYLDEFYRARLQALQGVDEIVEQVTKQLEDAGILDETYIIYSSDNGYHLGQHRLPPGKECGFDEDIRVPLFIRGPGVSSGFIDNAVTTHIDLAPTILRLAGADLRSDFDGTPIPVLPTQENKRHEHVAVEYWGGAIAEGQIGGFDGKGQIFAQNNTYKGVRIVHEDYNLYYSAWCNNEHELYDLKTDPGQLKNLFPHDDAAADTALLGTTSRQVLNRLDALMLVLKSCKGNTCIEPWKILHPEGGVTSLKDALQAKFNAFYKEQVKVRFDRCEYGYLIDAEGPQVGYEYREGLEWHHWT